MAEKFMQLVLTPAVQQAQEKYYGRHQEVTHASDADALTAVEIDFVTACDSFYMATVSETGWPYVQHRGGAHGFIKVLDAGLIGFADYQGNRQLVSTGNLALNDRVALFMMDYPRRRRLKVLGRARVLDALEHPAMADEFATGAARSRVERLFLIQVVSYDWNCPQYIMPRYSLAEVEHATEPLRMRIKELEAKLAAVGVERNQTEKTAESGE